MPNLLIADSETKADEQLDDEFSLNVRVVVANGPRANLADCSTDDGCGNTCENGASACDSFIGDPA
ncbi:MULTISPECIES: FxLD family lanthipeptide [Streptomyces]|uniref:FxLD family lanthipeptide n=1 Tax=Streptomyces TaxID=1883 RepID=UPI00345B9AC7